MCVAVNNQKVSHLNELLCGKLLYFYISGVLKTPFLFKLSRKVEFEKTVGVTNSVVVSMHIGR